MQRMPFSSLRPRNSEAQRCGHLWSMIPTRPELSRNAISLSPSSIRRIGSPSAFSSDDIAAGTQYCRINSPMIVPGPTRTRSSLSFLFIAFPPASLVFASLVFASLAFERILTLQFLDRRFPGIDREGDVLVGVRQRDVVFRLALEDAALAQQRVEAAHQIGIAIERAAIVVHGLVGEHDVE